jgi:DNA-binding response OmpR family regulator
VAEVDTAATDQTAGRKRATILVVEDDSALREFLCTALAEEFDVECAVSGEEALELAQRVRPDVVLLDVMLPGVNGLDVVRRIRSDPALSGIPVLVMTAFSEIEAGEAEAAGASRFLAKPFDLHELTAAVKDLL